jgi:parallel beta-helix repeat protein
MSRLTQIGWWSLVLATALVVGLASVAFAVDGVVLISQASALAGGVTPGDAPGFPVTINQPGSYRLESNLTVNADTTAIEITVNHVTLDLNGFAIVPRRCLTTPGGPPCPRPVGLGVDATDRNNVTVINGTVRGMGSRGLYLTGPNSVVERIRAVNNGADGIFVGDGATVRWCTAHENDGFGIRAGNGTIVNGNVVRDNVGSGIWVEAGGTVTGNTARGNNTGIIVFGRGGTVTGNTVHENHGFGLNLFGPTVGYGHNVMSGNSAGAVQGGTSLGQNLCDGVVC